MDFGSKSVVAVGQVWALSGKTGRDILLIRPVGPVHKGLRLPGASDHKVRGGSNTWGDPMQIEASDEQMLRVHRPLRFYVFIYFVWLKVKREVILIRACL